MQKYEHAYYELRGNTMNSELVVSNDIQVNDLAICIVSSNGSLLYANTYGKEVHVSLPDHFFTSFLSDTEEFKDGKTIRKHHIGNKSYDVHALSISINKKSNHILLVFAESQKSSLHLKEQLKEYQTYYKDLQTIFDISYDVLYVSDAEGNTIRASSACEKIWGKTPEKLIGKSVYELEEEGIYNPSATRMALEKKQKVQIIQTTKTGRLLSVVSTPIFDERKNITRIVNASRDITEIHELEEEIKNMKMLIKGYQKQLSTHNMDPIKNQIIYCSTYMQELIPMLDQIATVDSTVLITGESGVGKEVVANYIHKNSYRDIKPFIKINCAAIPDDLLESELFGYEAGAFTGATKGGKAGLFELANNGTLFLDEIGDMSLTLQTKLLRFLQDGEIRRVGGAKSQKINVRIIAATNQNLQHQIDKELFRKDLYYRLNVIPIKIIPLRKRKADIVPLVHHFLNVKTNTLNLKKTFSDDVFKVLENYDWPGNVRELENVVERLIVTSQSNKICMTNIPQYILDSIENAKNNSGQDLDNQICINELIPLKDAVSLVEKHLLEKAQKQYSTLNEIAQVMEVNQSTVSRKMHKYGLI